MNFFKRLFSFGKKKKEDDVESDVNQSLDSEEAIEEEMGHYRVVEVETHSIFFSL